MSTVRFKTSVLEGATPHHGNNFCQHSNAAVHNWLAKSSVAGKYVPSEWKLVHSIHITFLQGGDSYGVQVNLKTGIVI